MKNGKHIKQIMMLAAFILAVFAGCGKRVERQDVNIGNMSFRDIPGVTHDEIDAIKAIGAKYDYFICAINKDTDSFIDKNGEVSGYAVLFYQWLSDFFGIRFKPEFFLYNDLHRGLKTGEIDFTSELTDTPERQKIYFMSSPIAQRSIKYYRIDGSVPLEEISKTRRPRYSFLVGTVLANEVAANAGYDFETFFINNHSSAYQMLESGEIDAHVALDTTEADFETFSNVVSEDFFPLIFISSCLLTEKEELKPVISVLEKALDNRTLSYLAGLRKIGYQKYLENKLYTLLTEEERVYINSNPVIPIGAEFNNYPLSFFNTYTNQWDGIYFNVLDEISKLTGVSFEIGNDPNVKLPDLIKMLENGKVQIVPELFKIDEYKDRFLWSEIPLIKDNYAFITKADFRSIEINEISYLNVGVRKNSVYSELFTKMYPGHANYFEYDTMEETWDALKRGDVDVVFTGRRRQLIYTNYYEDTSYKLNLVFDSLYDDAFGYNKDAVVLRAIIDKALRLIKPNDITNQWMYRTYDYRQKLTEAQRPWFLGSIIMLILVLALLAILLQRSSNTGKRLEKLVKQRTGELSLRTSILKTVITSLPDIVFCKDLNLNYTLCNKTLFDLCNKKEEELIGKNDKNGTGLTDDEAKLANDTDRQVLREGKKIVFEEYVTCADGTRRLLETVKVPLIQDGSIVGVTGIGRDITKRKAMEEELKAASVAKSAFLANMSHELRTPLNTVIGLTDLVLEDSSLQDTVSSNLVKINNAGRTLLNIVNDLLDFSKIESGKLELTPIEYYTPSMLNDVITLVTTRLGEKPVTFILDIDGDLPSRLNGDDLRVKQIFSNLLSNAVKYTHKGTIELRVRCTRESEGWWMEVTVRDTGIGIREEDLNKLFSDYSQVDTRANRSIEGTGLGLSITKKLTEMMGGKISVQSEYGKGTAFSLRIRQGFVDETTIGPDIANSLCAFRYAEDSRIVSKKFTRLDLSYAKVLVVDDMPTNLDVATCLLGKYKMQVDCLTGGKEAVERIRGGNPVYNAIFMDHMMPGMDGIEAADAIRGLETEYAQKIPIIALTANAIQGTEELFYKHGFQAYISKPINIMELDSVIRKWVRDLKEKPEK